MGNQSVDRSAGVAVGFYQRIFVDWRKEECLAQEGRWAAQWVLRRLRLTPHDTMQRTEKIAKEVVNDFSRDIYHQR